MESIINKLALSGTRTGRAGAHALMIVRCPGKAGFFFKGIGREVTEGVADMDIPGKTLRATVKAVLWLGK